MEQQSNNFNQSSPLAVNRPKIITNVCILGFVGLLISIGILLVPSIRELLPEHSGSFILVTVLTTILSLIGLFGYWKMRRWGVYIYIAMLAITVVYGLVGSLPGIFDFIYFPVFVTAVGLMNFKKMT